MKARRLTLPVMFAVLAVLTGCRQDQETVLRLKERIIELQNRGDLGFREFHPCASVSGYGSFVPLEAPQVVAGGQLLIYFEPVNVFTNRGQGQYELWYTQDIVVLAEDGKVLYEEPEALDFRHVSRSPVFGLYTTNTLSLADLGPGDYVYKAVLHDKLKGASSVMK